MMSYTHLSNYLRMHRQRQALTQREIAVLLGVDYQPVVAKYESGRHRPPLDVLLAYRYIFKVPIGELFAGQYDRIVADVRRRAQRLSRELDAEPFTPVVKRKIDFITDLIHPPGA